MLFRLLTSCRGSSTGALAGNLPRPAAGGGCGKGGSGNGLLLGFSSTWTYSSSNDDWSGRTSFGGTGGIGLAASRDAVCQHIENMVRFDKLYSPQMVVK